MATDREMGIGLDEELEKLHIYIWLQGKEDFWGELIKIPFLQLS